MTKAAFWKADWFLGAAITLVVLLFSQTDLVQSLERKAYDLGVQASSHAPSDRIAVIAIDDQSIANLGRWPWSRNIHARLTDILAGAPAKVIGNTVFFSEAQIDPGYAYIQRLQALLDPSTGAATGAGNAQVAAVLAEAETALNTDRQLAASYGRANSVVLPMLFELGEERGRADGDLPGFVARNRLTKVDPGQGMALSGIAVQAPIATLGETARGVGHLNTRIDIDGAVRSEPLVIRYFDDYYPSLSLMLVARSLNLDVGDIRVTLGQEVDLGKMRIPTDGETRINPVFYSDANGRPPFAVDSFYDVLSGKIPAAKYAGKVVLIGATAQGVGSSQVTPVSSAMPPVLTLAHVVSSLLQADFFVVPPWAAWVSWAAFIGVGLYLAMLLPRLSAGVGALATAVLMGTLLGAHFGLMVGPGYWIKLMLPAVLLLAGHLLLTSKHFLLTEQGKLKADSDSAESNRLLGLAFQGQGQLDMAFDKFRRCPKDEGVAELLYNLALDYERKRQFNKAEAVFRYVMEFNPDFKDVANRITRAKQMSEAVMLAGARGQTVGGTIVLDGGTVEKPMLGRYQLEKELGKGAMGVVYLGRDPKINRIVAIKTMALSQEFDADELAEVKGRFFREAETAGRLNHPNIVTVYDAGEEQDLAYIAMEFLKGHDLVPYTKSGRLLRLPMVLKLVAQVADALDYAHANHVVHRDIKPANLMFEPASGQVKVTDFGIARITDSSKTRTGLVLGTPSYMSPEQLAGHKIDGRSDLFSLGVVLYQLCSGNLPFVGESMAQLMYKIANSPAANILEYRPDLPTEVVAVIDRALMKNVDERYQRGAEMAADLRRCMSGLGFPNGAARPSES